MPIDVRAVIDGSTPAQKMLMLAGSAILLSHRGLADMHKAYHFGGWSCQAGNKKAADPAQLVRSEIAMISCP
jgi:hypothetical protein